MLTCDKAASIGNLNDSFIKSLYLAAQGIELLKFLQFVARARPVTIILPLEDFNVFCLGVLEKENADGIHCAGDDGMREYGWRTSRPAKSKGETPAEHKLSEILKDSFRIYFPTRQTVANSKGGLAVSCSLGLTGRMNSLHKHLSNLACNPSN
jgi:hypothetical protein